MFPFDDKTFRYWNVKTNQWEIEGGEYELMVGACVADIRLVGTIHMDGTTNDFPYSKEQMPLYYSGLIQKVEDGEFARLLGYSPASGKWSGDLDINDAICQMYYAKSPVARMIYNRMTAMKKKSEDRGKPDLNILFIYNMPFRAIAKMTGGAVSMDMVRGMVKVVNGHFFKGVKQIMSGYFKNARLNKAYEKKLKGK